MCVGGWVGGRGGGGVVSSTPAEGKIQSKPKRRFIAQSLSHYPDMAEILLRKIKYETLS